MTSIVAYANTTNDDAQEWGNGTFEVDYSYLDVQIYTSTVSSSYRCSGLRFQLNVPQGATINSAIPSIHTTSVANTYSPDLRIYAHASDNAPNFSTNANVISEVQRPRTTAYVAWNGGTTLTSNAWNNGPDIKTVIQEIVNRAGWVSGNYIVILFIADSDATGKRLLFDGNEGGNAPYLTVDYTEAVVDPGYSSDPAVSGTVAFGNVTLGTTDTATLAVSETGGADLVISDPVIGGLNRYDFAITSPTFPITIVNGGAAVDITLSCTPYVSGARTATLTMTTNDPALPTVSYTLTATGVAVGSYPAPSTMTREVKIDWDHDETFDHALSDVTDRVTSAIWTEGFLSGQGDFAEPCALQLTLTNEDGAWWQDNSGATFYGLLAQGLRVRVRRTYNSKTYQQFIGNITAVILDPVEAQAGPRTVQIVATGPEQQLLAEGYTPPLRINTRIDTVIEEVLQRCLKLPYASSGWILGYSTLGINTRLRDSAGYMALNEAAETLEWAGAGSGTAAGCNAQSYLRQLVAAELGGRMFYDPRAGKMTFHSRRRDYHYPEIVWAMTGSDLVDRGADAVQYGANVINSVTIGYEQIKTGSAGSVLWEIDTPIQIRGGERREMTAQYRDPDHKTSRCAATDTIRPVAGVDYIANSQSDGTGDDRLNDLTVTVQFGAESASIKLVNGGGASLYVTTLQVRGTPLVSYDRREFTYSDPASIAQHGRRMLPNGAIDVPMVSAIDTIESYARSLVNREKTARTDIGAIYVRPSVNGSALWHILEYGVGARVNIDLSGDDWMEHDADYVIAGMRHEDDAMTGQYNVTIALWPAAKLRGWKLGYSRLGVDTTLIL